MSDQVAPPVDCRFNAYSARTAFRVGPHTRPAQNEEPMTKLILCESPPKARTIQRFLPRGTTCPRTGRAISGHAPSASKIRGQYKQEPWSNLGINVDRDFEPIYIVFPESRETVRELKQALRSADELLIATDEDREGESIGWHLCDELQPKVPVRRVVFHEITRAAVEEALANPRGLDANLVMPRRPGKSWIG